MTAAKKFTSEPGRLLRRAATAVGARPPKLAVDGEGDTGAFGVKHDGVNVAVQRGRHAGATAALARGRSTVGNGLDCDIVLTDAGIAARHLTLDMQGRSGKRTLIITANAAEALVGGEELAVGEPHAFDLPVVVDIRDVGLEFTDAAPSRAKAPVSLWLALPLAIAAGAGAGALITWATGSSVPQTLPRMASQPLAPQPSVALGDAARVMQRELAASGLDKHIKITQRDNVILAEGDLPLDAHPKWRQIKAAVRGNVTERLLIADMVKPTETGEGPKGMIAAVTNGKSPFVTGTNGRKAQVGEMLADGWIVKQITAEAVQLERGSQKVTVKLAP